MKNPFLGLFVWIQLNFLPPHGVRVLRLSLIIYTRYLFELKCFRIFSLTSLYLYLNFYFQFLLYFEY